MRRAKHPNPPALYGLRYNVNSGLYEIEEAGITYGMSLELTRDVKGYYHALMGKGKERPTVAKWYSDLSKEDKKAVIRTGSLPKQINDFFPDPQWD